MLRKRKGFTLLELIVVVIVIGILASIALPRYIRVAEKGRVAEAKSLLGEIKSAQLRYAAEHGTFASIASGVPSQLDLTFQTPKYFTLGVPSAGQNVSCETSVVAIATRNTVDNPVSGATYVINITQAGVYMPDATALGFM